MKTPYQEYLRWQAGVVERETEIGLEKLEREFKTGYSNQRLKRNLIKQRYEMSQVQREHIDKNSFK